MLNDVLINKAAVIERTVKRVREEYRNAGEHFATDYTRQDAAILNIQRALEILRCTSIRRFCCLLSKKLLLIT